MVSAIGLVVVLIPIWITIYALYPMLVPGSQPQVTTVLIVYVIYVLLAPIVLFVPLWQPHKAMLRYKHQQLTAISQELRGLVKSSLREIQKRNFGQLKERLAHIRQLLDLYDAIEKQTPVWPISIPTLQKFGAIASSPVLVGLVTLGLDMLGKQTIK